MNIYIVYNSFVYIQKFKHISPLYINAKMHSLCILNQYIAIKQNFQGIFVCLDKPFTQVRDKNFSEFRTR